ncbi:MAG: metal ABC transporter permease [Beijerinckiaceae bacterium]
MVASYFGLVLSYQLGLAAGPAIILVAGALYLLSMLLGIRDGLLVRPRANGHLAA